MTVRRRLAVAGAVVGALVLLAGCAAGPNQLTDTPGSVGFWYGLWQGLISPITFLISLFDSDVSIYEVHNNGNWYDVGFMLGVAIIFSGPAQLGGTSAGKRKQRNRSASPTG